MDIFVTTKAQRNNKLPFIFIKIKYFISNFNKIASIVHKKQKKVISYAKIETEIIILCLATANNHNPKIRKKPTTAIQLPY